MATAFDEEIYGQRRQVETMIPMYRDHQGAALTAHAYHTRRREMGLMVVTRNILILRLIKLFYRAYLSRFPSPVFLPRIAINKYPNSLGPSAISMKTPAAGGASTLFAALVY